ncbi:DNA primase [Methanocalculus chunghsingensis]|uniref:DNA primase DnaG n=1 Tax=Methanocalculus chunghsingensis TaxID=156457 RepID=A0A8J7W5K9_9EURY|nr:DNA primase DnaG [Methanocalculus chunghsingensis]MBR1368106.1 DNA primase [Methanocalculus chunghsingensis]
MYSPDTTKYLIHIHLETEGVVEKPDVVGAIFGQTEGLLGEDLDLRDLQRTGRVGRIDVQIISRRGETTGDIFIASSLDRAETAILAASLETIDRVGPCVSHVRVECIEDIRVAKRKKIIERAKELLLDAFDEDSIDSQDLLDEVRESIRIEKIRLIGDDRVPAGPNVEDSDAIIIVEGRADVLNLLRYGIKNSVAVEGTNVPDIVVSLCEKKTATVFLDGDRGGELILRELLQIADIDFVAYPPRGKSVEDLSRKEIVKALRNKVPVEYVRDNIEREARRNGSNQDIRPTLYPDPPLPPESPPVQESDDPSLLFSPSDEAGNGLSSLGGHIRAIKGSGLLRVLSPDFSTLGDYPLEAYKEILEELSGETAGIIIDQPVNQRILDLAAEKGLEFIAAREFSGIVKRPATVRMVKI